MFVCVEEVYWLCICTNWSTKMPQTPFTFSPNCSIWLVDANRKSCIILWRIFGYLIISDCYKMPKLETNFMLYLLLFFFKSRPINLAHIYATFSTSQYIDGKKSRNTWNFRHNLIHSIDANLKIRYCLLLNVSIVKPNFNNTMKLKQHKWVFVLFTLICC